MLPERGKPNKENIQYFWCGTDVMEAIPPVSMLDWVGKELTIEFDGTINCVSTGKKIRKTFGEGMSFQAWSESPLTVESVFRPELSRIHEGIALRDEVWEREHHLKPHWVYLTQTSEIKVGVTRSSYGIQRWMDQGAVAGIVIAEVPYRQLAGLMEVTLKEIFSDKTNWRRMLSPQIPDVAELSEAWEDAQTFLFETDEGFDAYFREEPEVEVMNYPVVNYPETITSLKLDKVPQLKERLTGVKGQYLLFESGRVMNVRSHAGYRVHLEVH